MGELFQPAICWFTIKGNEHAQNQLHQGDTYFPHLGFSFVPRTGALRRNVLALEECLGVFRFSMHVGFKRLGK